ncbi:hypothetical protein EXH44_05705 [Actinobacillus indolicus]|uniref:Opacity-associated protein A LysM-like domain-containing protein n=1 Tax=Actinobacillus indolicus TaxID=51049 RepID=A0A4P7CIE3_9PAST|nr:LysM-like peptidoglycan-binding domain-containing protein [Actinobacillus indolicus]QBQ63764.1 hypothetical protein EXH44_05705 [Actinobacillus indolicus]
MSQQNMRKEPTFGEPAKTVENTAAINHEEKESAPKLNFSLHSTKSPGHTFTPVMKRPTNASTPFASMEEQQTSTKEEITDATKEPATSPATIKNAGFAFAPVTEEKPAQSALKEQASTEPKSVQTEPKSTTETLKQTTAVPPTMNTNNIERVIPTQPQPEAKKPALNKVPSKYRRLILVGLLALALLLVFFLLKPNTPETVEQLQEQGNSLPIEFRPVDEAEAKRAEEEAKAMQEAQATQQATNEQVANTQTTAETTTTPSAQTPATSTPVTTTEATQTAPAQDTTPAVAVKPVVPAKPAVETAKPSVEKTTPVVNKPITNKPVVVEPVKKPTSSGSVIYQAETEKAQTTEKKVEKIKPAPQPKAEVKAEKVTTAEKPKAEVVTAKPATSAASGVVASKTLTVPKGVSLMQVFRDNNLNISDVNAMSKVNGAVSNLKVGEKVTVRLDKNNRVAEMVIGAGRYTRQADGSYTFR